jgi:HAD superfamily hydrolase (TIGR01549 family)
VLAAAGHPVPPRAIGDALADAYNALHDEELSLFPDAHETLDRLKELGVKLALITNGATEPQRAKVIRFALEHRFDHIQIEGEHGFGKPEERAYNHVMVSLGVRPHETWVVGDKSRMGDRGAATARHICDLARRLRHRPTCRLPDRPDRIIRRLFEGAGAQQQDHVTGFGLERPQRLLHAILHAPPRQFHLAAVLQTSHQHRLA